MILKKDIPTFTKLGEFLSADPRKPITRQTMSTHFKYLITKNYLQETEDQLGYYILNPDRLYFNIPLNTLQYLIENTNSFVIKVYIYLGTCWNIKPERYELTIKEICEHLGVQYNNYHSRIRNNLDLLIKLGLIDIDVVYKSNLHLPYMVLRKFTTNYELSNKAKTLC